MVPSPGAHATVVREYDWTADTPCFAVVDTIARYEGIETPRMAEHLPILHAVLDPGALDALLTDCPSLAVSFRYADYHVHLTDETVTISKPTPSILEYRME